MTELKRVRIAEWLKKTALDLGFDQCGIAKADFLEEEAPRLEKWLQEEHQGEMGWLEKNFDKRLDPRKLMPDARTVVVLTFNYSPQRDLTDLLPFKLARYAYGDDYHFVVKRRLKLLLELLRAEVGDINGRCFVDSAPLLERPWAAKAGLGWIGKNSLLLNKQRGSFFFICELLLDLELPEDIPVTDHCGTCTRCMDACPTNAIPQPYWVEAEKCISYLTIEHRSEIDPVFSGEMQNWIFGCDICQEVCPWNRFSLPNHEMTFQPKKELLKLTRHRDWTEMTEEVFGKIFKSSAVKRTRFEGLKRNIEFVSASRDTK